MAKYILEHTIRGAISHNIKKIRKDMGLTQQGLADRLLVTRCRLGAWEETRAFPPMEIIIRLTDESGTDLRTFLTTKLCD